jgi:isoleucyl-tRNA synthetase
VYSDSSQKIQYLFFSFLLAFVMKVSTINHQRIIQIFIFVNFENSIMTTLEMMDLILQYWKDNNAFQRSIDERSEQMQFRFFDGPPFAS